jgi:hypothetical protein
LTAHGGAGTVAATAHIGRRGPAADKEDEPMTTRSAIRVRLPEAR